MAKKRAKTHARQLANKDRPTRGVDQVVDRAPLVAANPPVKNYWLLGISVALFALWFIFLLITAIQANARGRWAWF